MLAVVAWLIVQRQRSLHLKRASGRNAIATVFQFHSRTKAETELQNARIASRIENRAANSDGWARFSRLGMNCKAVTIDNPKEVVAHTDQLVRELMEERGYPMGDFERRAADISVDHPAVVATYRVAQAIAVSDGARRGGTEELRKAVIYYRTLFDELLGVAHDRVAACRPCAALRCTHESPDELESARERAQCRNMRALQSAHHQRCMRPTSLLQVNTDGVSQTKTTREEAKLAPPLYARGGDGFRARWDLVQEASSTTPRSCARQMSCRASPSLRKPSQTAIELEKV